MEEIRVKSDAFCELLVKKNKFIYKSLHHCRLHATFPDAPASVHKVVCMSDMHSATSEVIDKLVKSKTIDKNTIVICTGDMAGNNKMGGDADALPDYVRLRDAAQALYLVQGNHDIYNADVMHLINDDGTWCCVDQRAVDTPLGRIAGVNGIMTDTRPTMERHKYPKIEYMKRLKHTLALKPDILLTHTPLTDIPYNVPIHLFGHAHMDPYIDLSHNGLRLNMDGRIFLFQ